MACSSPPIAAEERFRVPKGGTTTVVAARNRVSVWIDHVPAAEAGPYIARGVRSTRDAGTLPRGGAERLSRWAGLYSTLNVKVEGRNSTTEPFLSPLQQRLELFDGEGRVSENTAESLRSEDLSGVNWNRDSSSTVGTPIVSVAALDSNQDKPRSLQCARDLSGRRVTQQQQRYQARPERRLGQATRPRADLQDDKRWPPRPGEDPPRESIPA